MLSSFRNTVSQLPRWAKELIAISADTVGILLSIWVAFCLRLGGFITPSPETYFLYALAPVVAIPIFIRFGLYRAIFRYIGFHAVLAVTKAVTLYTAVLGLALFLISPESVPRSVILINGLVTLWIIGASRLLPRYFLANVNLGSNKFGFSPKNALIYGAGEAGVQLASGLVFNSDFKAVGFLDDARTLRGKELFGAKVYDPQLIEELIQDLDVQAVLLAMPSAPRQRIRDIVSKLDRLHVSVHSLPGMSDLASGRAKVEDLKEVQIEDLLGRDAVEPNQELLEKSVTGQSVLVTGAGGSIGAELSRQILSLNPSSLTLFDASEYALYTIDREIRELPNPGHTNIVSILGSVLNQDQIEHILIKYGVQTVYHAAAYKHVPLVEANPGQGIRNNVFGTYRTARAAHNAGVDTFVLISTDKAVRPTNVMGASKRMAELVLQSMARDFDDVTMNICMVRFGNVLASSGSVVPLFKKQIQEGGPVTVTHPDVTRYFMTIPEASQLVIQAGAMGEKGDVFLLEMGSSIKIIDLARRMIRLSGLHVKEPSYPGGEIEIEISGLRPGEKLYEELLIDADSTPTSHPLIARASENHISWDNLEVLLSELEIAIKNRDSDQIQSILHIAVPGYQTHVLDLA